MSTNIVILGGGGFIGTNLHQYLLESNINSISISRNFQKNQKNQIQTDALSINNIKEYLNPNTILIDLLNTSDKHSLTIHQKLIKELNKFSLNKIVFFSSAAVYGNTASPATEKTKTCSISQYGQSKIILEKIITNNKTPFLIFRPSSVYGPNQYPQSKQIIPVFFESILKNITPIINNNGQSIRDFIYIDDLIKTAGTTIFNQTGIYNLSTNIGTSINNLWQKIATLTKTKIIPTYLQNNLKEIQVNILNNQKIYSLTNYQFTNLDQGLSETCNWFKNNITKV